VAIPPSFITELLSRADIVDVVARHVQLKKAGINFMGLCPFHGEKSPSFIVSPTTPDLPLLRMRRARQRGRLPDGACRLSFVRCGEASWRSSIGMTGARRRHARPPSASAPPRTEAAPRP
jgi:hypothetical protein